eukprot:gnl/Chilomastix_cuspidata/1182.p1 GENE.gnl/Chilomastix_cuspidata/1182~~gnl/Chilomastix_cuspidata/1182.p1  ORF type:complete len:461 (-),score=159.76 gnl/Chilomastix_cuspidata/1182:735-1949(-)
MGSIYQDLPSIVHLFEKKIFVVLTNLSKCTLSLKDISILASISSKAIAKTEEIDKYYTPDEAKAYINFLLRLSRVPGLSERDSHRLFSKSVFLLSCVNKEEGGRVLWDYGIEEMGAGRPFNAGHSILDWLFCVTDGFALSDMHISKILDLLRMQFDHFLELPRSEISFGYCKSIVWFISNFRYFFNEIADTERKEHIAQQFNKHGLNMPARIAAFGRVMRVTIQETARQNDPKLMEKTFEMIAVAANFYDGLVDCSSFETFVNIWAATADPTAAAPDMRVTFTTAMDTSLRKCILEQRVDAYGMFATNARAFVAAAGPNEEARAAATAKLFHAIYGFALFSGPKQFHALNMLSVVRALDAAQYSLFVDPIVSLVHQYLQTSPDKRTDKILTRKLLPASAKLLGL